MKIKAILLDLSRKLTPVPTSYQLLDLLKKQYQSAVSSLIYTMLGTRPDIVYTVSVVSRFASNLTPEYYAAVDDIFCYLRGTLYYELTFSGYLTLLHSYTDSN